MERRTQRDVFFGAFARANDAVEASVDIQRALATSVWPHGLIVRLRMGLHTGEPSLGPEGYMGLDPVRSACLMNAGHGGQVLLSQTTYDLVEHQFSDDVSVRDLGTHLLKDLQHPSRLFQLVIANLPSDFPPLFTLDIHPHNLPIQPTVLIGREKEVARIEHLLSREDSRLVTLTGPGGIGKTRLGLQVAASLADRFSDGVYFVNLAPISDPEFVLSAIAQALAIKEVAGQTLFDLLKAWLREKQLLILLDNFEQVIDAAGQVAALLASCPNFKIVVTSRIILRVQAEREFAVPSLGLPDPKHLPDPGPLTQYEAVALFLQRAQAVKPEFQVTTANAPAIAEICIRLDGLPLAIELAAARIKLLPPQVLLTRLGQQLNVLTGGARDVPARQQTLRNTIAWSYQLLDADEQRLFRRLSVFSGGCTLQTVEEIAARSGEGASQVLEGVASLLDKSMLRQSEEQGEEPRLLMLETLRAYGQECLEVVGEKEAVKLAHAAYYLRLAEAAEQEMEGPEQPRWLERLEREHAHLRAAFSWWLEQGESKQNMEMALRLSVALEQFWLIRGHANEGRIFLERALARREGVALAVQARALSTAAWLAINQGDSGPGKTLCAASLALWQELGDTTSSTLVLQRLAVANWSENNPTTARSLMEEALAYWQAGGNKRQIVWILAWLAYMASQQGEYSKALALGEESLAHFRALESKTGLAGSLGRLTEVFYCAQGDPASIRALCEEALALSQEMGYKLGMAYGQRFAGQLAFNQGDLTTARSLITAAISLFKEIGHPEGLALTLSLLARVNASQEEHTEPDLATPEQATLSTPGEQLTPSPPSTYGLTARELEVLRVVAQGLTNEQVAERLVISPRTVDTHLTSIYSKIGVSSRSAATRFALDNHLV